MNNKPIIKIYYNELKELDLECLYDYLKEVKSYKDDIINYYGYITYITLCINIKNQIECRTNKNISICEFLKTI